MTKYIIKIKQNLPVPSENAAIRFMSRVFDIVRDCDALGNGLDIIRNEIVEKDESIKVIDVEIKYIVYTIFVDKNIDEPYKSMANNFITKVFALAKETNIIGKGIDISKSEE